MSCYNEENGSFILPAAAIASFRRGLVQAVNKEKEKAFEVAKALHAYITQPIDKGNGKPPRKERLAALNKALKKDYYTAERVLNEALDALDPDKPRGLYQMGPTRKWSDNVREMAIDLVLPHHYGKPMKFQAPKKKDLSLAPSNATTFSNDDAGVSIDPKTRTVTWHVGRNNRAVDRARESVLGAAFFEGLSKVKWTRNTGGHIRYTDEYMVDSAMEHGGEAISTVSHMGPLGTKQQEHEWGPHITRTMRSKKRYG